MTALRLRAPARLRTFAAACGLASTLVLGAAGCSRKAADATPDGAVREWLELMQGHRGAAGEAKAAFQMLSTRARENLITRAERYSATTGKVMPPEAMIVPSSFSLRFEPIRLKAEVIGPHALVEVRGSHPNDVARIPCVFENGKWRVDIALPPPPAVQRLPVAP